MVLYLALGVLIGILFVLAFFKLRGGVKKDDLLLHLDQKINEAFPQALKTANEQLVLMARQKLTAEKQDIKTDLDNKKTAIEDLVKRILEDMTRSGKRLEDAERDRIGSFRELKKEVENQRRITEQLSVTTEGLKRVLSNNQLRGQFGERVAEDLLKMAGFVKGVDYQSNKDQKSSNTRPDFTVFLPDGAKINIDAKFPYNNLQKAVETQDLETKRRYIRDFTRDIKEKIKQVTSREYINPEENTVDFVIMFIPNEMIFSYIYDRMNEVWLEALKQKVIMAGPFSFTAILRLVRQAYDNFRFQKDVQKIIVQIKIFDQEFKKYNLEFEKIGDRIRSLTAQYQKVDITRTNQLNRAVDRIKLEDAESTEVLSLESPKTVPPLK
ncbi:MAG: DNA recombination protein RmuC [Patescibacteria group bacterium]|nr:DNA recombination protein RmuC [Patescibacteria group bacterium]